MIKLEVFGESKLIDTNQRNAPLTASLPLLIAAYVVIEHQGEVKRERAHQIFFPMKPVSPENFYQASKIIYEKFWEYGKSSLASGDKYSIDHKNIKAELPDDLTQYAQEIKSTCIELKNYCVIENYHLQDNSLDCWLSSSFKKYLSDLNDPKKDDKKQRIRKTFSEHIGRLRKFITLPSKKGQSNNDLIIRLDVNVTDLEKALANNDFDKIKTIYRGPFLSDIENKVRSNVWLSPELRFWIQTKRQ